jgi:hypothetical protein
MRLVGPVGLEPTTYGLKVRSSAIELEAQAVTEPHPAHPWVSPSGNQLPQRLRHQSLRYAKRGRVRGIAAIRSANEWSIFHAHGGEVTTGETRRAVRASLTASTATLTLSTTANATPAPPTVSVA